MQRFQRALGPWKFPGSQQTSANERQKALHLLKIPNFRSRRCSTSLFIKERQIKTTMWDITSHQSKGLTSENPQTINAGEGTERSELSHTVGRNVNWCSHYGEEYGDALKKLKIELPYDPAIPLLGTYLEGKKIVQRDTCTAIFIASLFIIVRTWKQPKCPLTDLRIKKRLPRWLEC